MYLGIIQKIQNLKTKRLSYPKEEDTFKIPLN